MEEVLYVWHRILAQPLDGIDGYTVGHYKDYKIVDKLGLSLASSSSWPTLKGLSECIINHYLPMTIAGAKIMNDVPPNIDKGGPILLSKDKEGKFHINFNYAARKLTTEEYDQLARELLKALKGN